MLHEKEEDCEYWEWFDFAIYFHPVLEADSRLLAGILPTIVSDANKLVPCPPLPKGCTAEQLVDQAMLDIKKKGAKYEF